MQVSSALDTYSNPAAFCLQKIQAGWLRHCLILHYFKICLTSKGLKSTSEAWSNSRAKIESSKVLFKPSTVSISYLEKAPMAAKKLVMVKKLSSLLSSMSHFHLKAAICPIMLCAFWGSSDHRSPVEAVSSKSAKRAWAASVSATDITSRSRARRVSTCVEAQSGNTLSPF